MRQTLSMLRQPRYATLTGLMAIIAIGCVAAGVWQIARFENKVHENDALRANADRPPTAVAALLPLVNAGRTPDSDAVEFRHVIATGRYDARHQSLVRNRTLDDAVGFLVVTPLRTADGTLLVVRGFVPPTSSGDAPAVPAPPAGVVTIRARAHAPESRHDAAGELPSAGAQQVLSINAADQQARLGRAVFDGYAELEARQPGSAHLVASSAPDLSNPAGGALEPQHFAYVIQWFLFAVLALAAPYVMARAELRARGRVHDADRSATLAQQRSAKLADRYGSRH